MQQPTIQRVVHFGRLLGHHHGFGEHRTTESNKPIDDSGELLASDVNGPFKGGLELAARLAQSNDVAACATKQLVRFSLGHKETAADQCIVQLAVERAGVDI